LGSARVLVADQVAKVVVIKDIENDVSGRISGLLPFHAEVSEID